MQFIVDLDRLEQSVQAVSDKIKIVSGDIANEITRAKASESALDDKIAANNTQIGTLKSTVDAVSTELDTISDAFDNLTSTYLTKSEKAAAGGVATLDSNKKLVQMPSASDVGAMPANTAFVPPTRTVNGKALSANISLIASDVGAAAVSHTHDTASQSAAGFLSTADKTKLDGIATGANNYVHPTTSGNKHIPSGGSSGQILRWSADGTAVWGADNNTTYTVFVKSGSGAKAGLVPAPSTTAGTTKYLREDGTWSVPPDTNTTYDVFKGATTAANGTTGLVPAPAMVNDMVRFLRGDGTWGVPNRTVTTGDDGLVPKLPGNDTTFFRGDGSWATPPDTKYTHPTNAGNKHIPAGGSSGQILGWSSDGTATWINTVSVASNVIAEHLKYRGRLLGNFSTEFAADLTHVKDGTFEDFYLGDYYILNGGQQWEIVDINYYYDLGTSAFRTNHLVLRPKFIYEQSPALADNASQDMAHGISVTKNGFYDTTMYLSMMANSSYFKSINTRFGNKLISFPVYTNGAWRMCGVDFQTTGMLYGNLDSVDTKNTTQLAINKVSPTFTRPKNSNGSRSCVWLRSSGAANNSLSCIFDTGEVGTNQVYYDMGWWPIVCVG